MIDFSNFLDNIKNAVSGDKKKSVAVVLILLIMTVSAIIIISITVDSKTKTETIVEQELEPNHQLVVPPSPAVPEGYVYSRERNGRWTEEDAEKWFTQPTETTLDELSAANERIITEITGAAP